MRRRNTLRKTVQRLDPRVDGRRGRALGEPGRGLLGAVAARPGRGDSPAAGQPRFQNCVAKGGSLSILKNGSGGEYGLCSFPDNRQCEEWAMLRGECPVGGLRVTGYVTPAARYCAITGGQYTVTRASNTPDEQGTCAFRSGKSCDARAYYEGACRRS